MKKFFPAFLILAFFSFTVFSQNYADAKVNANLLSAQTFPQNSIRNLTIETTYENLQVVESYGTDLSLELYCNNNKLLPEITTTENSLTIKSTPKKTTAGDICQIILYIPADTNFENFIIKTGEKNKGNISLANLKSDILNIETYNSNVSGSFLSGNITIKSVNGNVEIDNISSENSAIFTKNGQISIKNAQIRQFSTISDSGIVKINNFTGEYILLKTEAGNIIADNLICDYFDINSKSGDVSISLKETPTGSSNLHSDKGFVQCFIPEEESFTLVVHSTKGTFFNKLDKSRNTPRHDFIKDYNNGGAEIAIKTFSGDIEVDRY